MKKWILRLFLFFSCAFLIAFWQLFFSTRPALMIEPQVLAGDGSTLNYCDLPTLDNSGKKAVDIPKGNTPGCSYTHFPLPVLAECTEPLPPEADDIRGLWLGVEGGHLGHVERVEQCGSRVVITGAGIIHDGGPNANADTIGLNSNDTEGAVVFTIGEKEYCARSSASMTWHNKVLEFNAFGWGPVVVKRYRDGEQLVWEYADGSKTIMDRICHLPANKKIPEPRGRRMAIF